MSHPLKDCDLLPGAIAFQAPLPCPEKKPFESFMGDESTRIMSALHHRSPGYLQRDLFTVHWKRIKGHFPERSAAV